MKEMSIKRATMISAISKYSVIVMNIFFTAILARILTPKDYGVVAIVTIFTTLFFRIGDMGFGSAIIQFKKLDKNEINQIFSFTVLVAFILGVLFIVLGFPISIFFGNKIYIKICAILSISIFYNCINMIPNSILLRDKKFVAVGVRLVVVNIIGYLVAITFAIMGWKYYALVFQSVIAAILNFFWNNYSTKLKFILGFKFGSIKKVWKYSIFEFIFGWVNYLETNLDNILIGGFMGSVPLAYYDKGYKLICYPMNNIAGVVQPVLHPILKEYQDNKEFLLKKYIEVQKNLSLIAIVFTPIFFCACREIINILYGEQWKDAIMAFQFLSISIYPKVMMGTTGAIYCSANNTKMLFRAGLINATVTGICIFIGIQFGSINMVALLVSIANWCNMFVTFFILIKIVLGQPSSNYFKEFLYDILSMFFIMFLTILFSRNVSINNVFISLISKTFVIGIMYLSYLFLSSKWRRIYRMVFSK